MVLTYRNDTFDHLFMVRPCSSSPLPLRCYRLLALSLHLFTIRYPTLKGQSSIMCQTDYVDVLGGGTHYFMKSKVSGTTITKFHSWNPSYPRNSGKTYSRGCAYSTNSQWKDASCTGKK